MPSKIELLLEAEKRGILPKEKVPLLAEARKRGLVPGGGPPSTLTPQGNIAVPPPPNEPGLEQVVPITDPLKMGLEHLQGKSEQARSGMSSLNPAAWAMKIGEAGLGAAQGFLPSTSREVGTAMAVGPAMEAAGTITKPLVPYVQKFTRGAGAALADVIGELSGKDAESVKVLFNNPKAMWQKATELFGRKHQEATVKAIEKDFAERGAQFRAIEDSLSGNFGTPSYGKASEVITRPAFDDVRFQLAKEGFRLPKGLIEGYPDIKIGKIAEDAPEYKFLIESVKKIKDNPRLSFGDALRLKQNLDKAIDYGLEGSNGIQPISEDASRLLSSIRKSINKEMRSSLNTEQRKVWDTVNEEYGVAAQSRAELRKQVLGQSARLTEKKLHQLLKEGRYDDEVLDRTAALGANAKKRLEDVRDHIAARQFKSWAKAPNAHGFIPSSPALYGHLTSAAGGASQAAQELAKKIQNYPMIMGALATHAASRDEKAKP